VGLSKTMQGSVIDGPSMAWSDNHDHWMNSRCIWKQPISCIHQNMKDKTKEKKEEEKVTLLVL
jgi:hypothetical protein